MTLLNGILAVLFIWLGVYAIYRRRGGIITRSRSTYIATGSYAVWVGVGQVIIGLGFLIFALAFLWNFVYGCIAFPIVLLLGVIGGMIQNQGYDDPDVEILVQKDKEYNQTRDGDPDVQQTRRRKMIIFIVFSVIPGAIVTSFLIYDVWPDIIQEPLVERVQFFWGALVMWAIFSGMFFLPFLKFIRRQLLA